MINRRLTSQILNILPVNGQKSYKITNYYNDGIHPYIKEYSLGDVFKCTTKRLADGRSVECFEEGNGVIHKVLKDSLGNPIAINTVTNGKKQKTHILANFAYSNILNKFREITK